MLKPTTYTQAWFWQQLEQASGGLTVDGDALKCQVVSTDGTDWHIQLFQAQAILVDGHQYRLRFTAKSDRDVVAKVVATVGGPLTPSRGPGGPGLTVADNPDYHNVGLDKNVPILPNWVTYDYTFTAEKTDGKLTRLPVFQLGAATATIWIKDVILEEV